MTGSFDLIHLVSMVVYITGIYKPSLKNRCEKDILYDSTCSYVHLSVMITPLTLGDVRMCHCVVLRVWFFTLLICDAAVHLGVESVSFLREVV